MNILMYTSLTLRIGGGGGGGRDGNTGGGVMEMITEEGGAVEMITDGGGRGANDFCTLVWSFTCVRVVGKMHD